MTELMDEFTLSFRLSVLAGLAGIGTFMWRVLTTLRQRAKLEQRVERHLEETEPMIAQFHQMVTAITSGEVRHQAVVDRLDRFVAQQDAINARLTEAVDRLMLRH